MLKKRMQAYFIMAAAMLSSCSVEDPSVESFDLNRILLGGIAPFKSGFEKPSNSLASKQANLYYALSNGDTMKISVYEYEDIILARAFFYNSDSLAEKTEFWEEGEHKRHFRHGRRVFVATYAFSISENSSMLDSLLAFSKRFPASASAGKAFQSFSLKNSRADEDISVQSGYFLGIEAPFHMLARKYRDADFSWVCARSSAEVSDSDWESYLARRQDGFYEPDSAVLMSRLHNGIVVAVYGDLDKGRLHNVFKEFAELVK